MMTNAVKELSPKKRHEALEEYNKALHLKCIRQSKRVRELIAYSDYLVKQAKTLIQGKSKQ
jgi:hypothetical protein